MPLVNNDVYLELARMDFNHCQALHQLEWQGLKKYVRMYVYIQGGMFFDLVAN